MATDGDVAPHEKSMFSRYCELRDDGLPFFDESKERIK
jgi:hypothetical protein